MIDIVLVNWNSGSQLGEALVSIVDNHENLVDKVIVVDNASSDDSMSDIGIEGCKISLQVIFNEENLGFGVACNQGAKLCESDYILFLNPDARLLVGSLSIPLTYMQKSENSSVGITGIQLVDSGGKVSRSCSRFPTFPLLLAQSMGLNKFPWLRSWGPHMSEWDHGSDREVDQVIGAFFLIRRPLFENLGGFDERFFVYFEEVDVSYRAKLAGWRSMYLTGARAFHAGGGTSTQVKASRLFYSLRSRLLYAFKHFSYFQAWLLVGVTFFIEPLTRAIFSFARSGIEGLCNTLQGYGMLWKKLPDILKGSRK